MALARVFLVIAALYGATGVMLGAFGAHGLRSQFAANGLAVWQTAVQYHMVHALALFGVGLWLLRSADALHSPVQRPLMLAGWGFAAGVVLFSGSLYALALGGPRALGPVTPLGGLAFIGGWLALAWAGARSMS